MDEKELKKLTDKIDDQFNSLQESIKGKANADSIAQLKDELTSMIEAAGKIKTGKDSEEKTLGEYLQAIQEQTNSLEGRIKEMQLQGKAKGQKISTQLIENFKADTFKKVIATKENLRRGYGFELKAANIDTADINSGTIEDEVEAGVSKAAWRPTPIWDAVGKGVIGQGRDSISWWEETTRTDSAEFVAEEAGPAAGSAKTFTKQNMTIMIVKDYTKVSREALEDFEYMRSEVMDLLQNGIPREREAQLLSGPGTTHYLKGIDEYAKTFSKPSAFDKVAAANKGDVLAAAVLQVMLGNTSDAEKKGFLPNIIMINPADRFNMIEVKNSMESYVKHPLMSMDNQFFDGIQVVPNLDMPSGYFLVGDFSRAKIYVKRQMEISFHYENEDDVLNDLVLVLASARYAGLKVSAADAYAFVYGAFSSGIEAIQSA